MLTDALLQLSSAQAVTASAVSTNTIDLSQVRDPAGGEGLYVVITVDQSATAAGAATVTFQVITSAAANLSSPNILVQTDAIAKTELTAARRPIALRVPDSILAAVPLGQRYLGVQYTVGTGPLTGGAFSALLVDSTVSLGKLYPRAVTVA